MLDIALLSLALADPGREMTDGVIEAVMLLAQDGERARAAGLAAERLGEGCTDMRIIAAFMAGVFEERGPEALPAIFGALAEALGPRWEALQPAAKRDRVADSALSFLLRSIKATIDFHESVRDPVWQMWAERVTRDLPAASTAAAASLGAAIAARIDKPRSSVELAGLTTRTSTYFNRLPPAPAPAPAAAEPAPSEPGAQSAPISGEPATAPPPSGERASAPSAPDSAPHAHMIEISPALLGFIRKLDAFAILVQRGDMARAAIVAQDIRAGVERFDPRVYLPKLLSPHFLLLSAHVNQLAPHWDAGGGPAWEALSQLYQVDLDAFLAA